MQIQQEIFGKGEVFKSFKALVLGELKNGDSTQDISDKIICPFSQLEGKGCNVKVKYNFTKI